LNKILIGFIVIGLFIGLFYLGYNMGNKNITLTETEDNTVQDNLETPAGEYTISQTMLERELKMEKIYDIVEQKYSTEDETTQKIIGLCMAGNIGSCSLLERDYNIVVGVEI
jgi:hypothetical protein